MPAPLVAAAAAKPALQVTEKLVKALTGDIVVLKTRVYRKVKVGRKTVQEPVDVDVHVNAVSLGIAGLVVGGLALGAAVLAATARDRTTGKIGAAAFTAPGWYDSVNRTTSELGWTREPGQLFYHRPKTP